MNCKPENFVEEIKFIVNNYCGISGNRIFELLQGRDKQKFLKEFSEAIVELVRTKQIVEVEFGLINMQCIQKRIYLSAKTKVFVRGE